MSDSTTQAGAASMPIPMLTTDSSNLMPTTPAGSPPPASPSSLAPPEGSPVSVLSRPVSPSVRDSRRFHAQISTKGSPETPFPKSLRDKKCPCTGLYVSTSAEWLSQGLPLGVRVYVHKRSGSPASEGPGASSMPAVRINEPKSLDSQITLGPIDSILTSGPTMLIGDKPCMLTASPLPEHKWRISSQAIGWQYNKQAKKILNAVKMQDNSGRYLNSLRQYQARSRANSVASAFKSALPISTIGLPTEQTVASTKAGRVWLCNMGCEGATGRKRDWALVELDPNVAGTAERRNVVLIDGKEIVLKAPMKSGAKPGTRVIFATAGSRNIPLGGIVGEKQDCVFGYQTIQKIVLDRDYVLGDGDAGSCVVDEAGHCYGILVMVGMLKKEVEEKKKAGEAQIKTQSVAWFVPMDRIIEDICITYPLDHITFGP